MRVLAVKMEDGLFDEVKDHIKEKGLTLQKYINELVEQDVHQIQEQQQKQEQVPPKNWEKDEVKTAIANFIQENGRAPSQKEYKNENGLPSYGAAARSLEESPAQYAQRLMEGFDDTQDTIKEGQTNGEEQRESLAMSM